MYSKTVLNHFFVSYINQVIKRSALAYYRKKLLYQQRNSLYPEFYELTAPYHDSVLDLDSLSIMNVNHLEDYIDNKKLALSLGHLKHKEKQFIYEKYILCKTDKEIAIQFNITRQGVSIFKKRILKKISHYYKRIQ
ncbi:TPA: sigma-70 family RNA polymerase sigma factor [Listeria innocua]|nr:sigma-70 family RNA polymerase sigma factor [Listeria innocua]